MPYIPHNESETRAMLDAIGVGSIEDLFDEIPDSLRCGNLDRIPEGLSEAGIGRLMQRRARQDGGALCFIGAGAYEHHIPAAVWDVTTRGEFYSAYTPYQAEASQGTLQLVYEFQSMMTALTGLDVSNASLYDGASALAEAVLMAVRANRKSKSRRILMPSTVHPVYRQVVQAIVRNQGISLETVAHDPATGRIDPGVLAERAGQDYAALVIPQPNFFGLLEPVDELTDWAAANGCLSIAVVNPLSLSVLKAPGQWGGQGVDIACGEGQPLGIPLASGGPYFGFMCCKQKHVRQVPGRIVGGTVDMDGKRGYTLTLQAREQHIRRSKATSNICTNQGLMVTAATIHMSIMGSEGLASAASASHANTRELAQRLANIEGVELVFEGAYFHEIVVRMPCELKPMLRAMGEQNILAGYALGEHYPELDDCLLICATEARTSEDIDHYVEHLERILIKLRAPDSPVQPKTA